MTASAGAPGGRLDDAVRAAREEAAPILERMLAFDTSADSAVGPAKQDAEHQRFVAGYLGDLGLEVELLEPGTELFEAHRMAHPGQTFDGRPILWARLPGAGRGPSLLFNGHYDTVPVGPRHRWRRSPSGERAGDRIYGRGACDMKGGNAAAVAAIAGIREAGLRLDGDVFLNLVPFEEVNGMGTTATMLLGKTADVAICAEPTRLRPTIASRGILELELTVAGRSAHGEIPQPHHSEGGAVNAIDKAVYLLAGIKRLDEQWKALPRKRHDLLSPPAIIATTIQGGTFWATWPDKVTIEAEVIYLPADADEEGTGAAVMEEFETFVRTLSAADDWLAEHPPEIVWRGDVRPVEVRQDHPLVRLACEISNHPPAGFDSSADHLYLITEGSIPSILLGPGDIAQAHTVDEYLDLAELDRCAQLYVELAAAWTSGR
jgi:acetylornithine deacetylase